MKTPFTFPLDRIHSAIVLTGLFWVASLAVGFSVLSVEQYSPTLAARPEPTLPPESALAPEPGKPLLLFFAHPHCPCTRASLHELNRLVEDSGTKASLRILFVMPEGVPAGWEKGELLDYAAKIRGARIVLDRDGVESKRFAVNGSGETLLYSSEGKLLFHGGITPSRGHEGESAGRSALTAFLLHGIPPLQQSPSYGCALLANPRPTQPL